MLQDFGLRGFFLFFNGYQRLGLGFFLLGFFNKFVSGFNLISSSWLFKGDFILSLSDSFGGLFFNFSKFLLFINFQLFLYILVSFGDLCFWCDLSILQFLCFFLFKIICFLLSGHLWLLGSFDLLLSLAHSLLGLLDLLLGFRILRSVIVLSDTGNLFGKILRFALFVNYLTKLLVGNRFLRFLRLLWFRRRFNFRRSFNFRWSWVLRRDRWRGRYRLCSWGSRSGWRLWSWLWLFTFWLSTIWGWIYCILLFR